MRVLVTGATGLIGSAVSDALLARGNEVVGLTRDPGRARSTNPRVTWRRWVPAAERPPANAFTEVGAVVNLIGEEINQRLTPEAKRRIRDSRLRATKNLVDGMVASGGPRVLVSQSAVGYYGDGGEAMIDESTPGGEGSFLAELVGEWEAAAQEASKGGIRVAITRSGLLLDPEGGLLKQLLLPFKLGVGGPLAGGRWYMPWIHRDDEIGLILWAIENGRVDGVINASAPNPVTNRDFSKALGRTLRRPSAIPAPKLALRVMRGEELTASILSSLRVVPRRALDLGYEFRFTELEPALRDLLH